MAMSDVIARVKAKQEEKYQQRQADKAQKKLDERPTQGDGNVFSEDEMDAMERASDRRIEKVGDVD